MRGDTSRSTQKPDLFVETSSSEFSRESDPKAERLSRTIKGGGREPDRKTLSTLFGRNKVRCPRPDEHFGGGAELLDFGASVTGGVVGEERINGDTREADRGGVAAKPERDCVRDLELPERGKCPPPFERETFDFLQYSFERRKGDVDFRFPDLRRLDSTREWVSRMGKRLRLASAT